MRDLTSWRIPLATLSGVPLFMHILYPVVALGVVLRVISASGAPDGIWREIVLIQIILLLSVMLRLLVSHQIDIRTGGSPSELTVWNLGHFTRDRDYSPSVSTLLAGLATSLMVAAVSSVVLMIMGYFPPSLVGWDALGFSRAGTVLLAAASGDSVSVDPGFSTFLARLYIVNAWLFLANLLPVIPLDGARLLERLLGWRMELREAALGTLFASMLGILAVAVAGIAANEVLFIILALFLHLQTRLEAVRMEVIPSAFGYDDHDDPDLPPRASWWQRWKARRAEERTRKAAANRVEEDRRMDSLLDKLHRLGQGGLTGAEHRFMRHYAEKYRPRQRGR